MMEMMGLTFALTGAALAVFLAGIGSSIGLGMAGKSATAVLSEKPERYGTLMLMVVLPSTQGIYGFVVGLFVMIKLNMFAGAVAAVTWCAGSCRFWPPVCRWRLPAGSARIHQGKNRRGRYFDGRQAAGNGVQGRRCVCGDD